MFVTYPNQTLAIVTLADLFSKYGDCRVIPIRAGTENISSERTKEAFEEMLASIDKLGYDVESVYTDNGNEFSKNFDKYLAGKKIKHIFGQPDDKRMTSPIERFNSTLRLSIEKYKMIYGRITQKSIADIVHAYNSSSHSVGYTPLEILKDSKIRDTIKNQYVAKRKKYINTNVISGYFLFLK
jgi:transposase InsO family protein